METKCRDSKCPKKNTCRRFTKKEAGWLFKTSPRGVNNCQMYIKHATTGSNNG